MHIIINIANILFALWVPASALYLPSGAAGAPGVSDRPIKHYTVENNLIVRLPSGTKPEGVAAAAGKGFFVSGLGGHLLFVDAATQSAVVVATEANTLLTGVKYDDQYHRIFATGALSGKAFIFQLQSGSFTKTSHRTVLLLSIGGYINDVTLGKDDIYFSDSFKPYIYSIPRHFQQQEKQQPAVTKHFLAIPAFIGVPMVPLLEAANGLAEVAPGVVIIANYKQGQLYKLDVKASVLTKVQMPANIDGRKVWPDGLLAGSSATLYVADNFNNRLLKVKFSDDYASANVDCVIESPDYNTPTTLAQQAGYLWAVNAHFLDCLFMLPCTWQQYEIVGAKMDELCM